MNVRRRNGLPYCSLHVMNRGARKVSIFAGAADRSLFVGLLGRFALKHEVEVTSWCLMPNHYHIETRSEGTPLWQMMRDLDGNYARAFNERHKTKGCLFQGPFKSTWIYDDEGLAYVSRYIHLNPLDLGADPTTYLWSSCPVYLGRAAAPPWLHIDPVLSWVETSPRSGARDYGEYLSGAPPRRQKEKPPWNDEIDFYCEWIRHLEEKLIELMLPWRSVLGRLATSTVVCWVAQRKCDVPTNALAAYYGHQGSAAVRSCTSRLQQRASEEEELMRALESIAAPIAPPRK